MASEEKRAWILLLCAVGGYTAYQIALFASSSGSIVDAPYAAPLLWSIGGSILASIALDMLFVGRAPKKDARDHEIAHFGDRIGQAFLVIGGVAALVLALVEANPFWIANAVYLAFVLSGVLGSIARIAAYRVGLPQW